MLRLGVGIVFVMWTVDKFINPEHAAAVFAKFYNVQSLTTGLAYVVGGVQMLVVLAFLTGTLRTYSYAVILILHAISTFSSYKQYFDPWTYPHLLFFAAIPMLAACVTLWLLRDYDLFSVDGQRRKSHEAIVG
ncbi:hypothetical protein Pla22_20000 [Rubripirellula amarantea]|uniref:Methylamine utilisation protein MauE domain-containing protein n=2 Tax=Rubripirellula amarantea TaxID=2527999 RepID=A0A5C5WWJ9_9BACT|nr:hypothetical protein Pla22_20000 [Rubripirellula amarantea]